MPSSRPPLFDRGDDPTDDPKHDRHDEHADDDNHRPNYLARRAVAVGAAVAVIVGAATAVGWVLRDDGKQSTDGVTPPDWNTVVLVEEATGTIVLDDEEGTEISRVRLGMDGLLGAAVTDTTFIATNAQEVAIVDLTEPETIDLIEIVSDGAVLLPSGSAQTMMVRDENSQRAIFVHGPSGESLDTDDEGPIVGARFDFRLARSTPSGREILVTDAGNFQSVLFSFDRDAPSFFPGLAMAIDDDIVVTTQNVGNAANVSIFDHDQEVLATASTPSVRAAIAGDGSIVIVTVEGAVMSMSADGGDVGEVTQLSIGTIESGHVTVRGDRLVVIGSDGTAILDTAGSVVAEVLGGRPTTTGIDDVAPRRSDCLIASRAATGDIVVLDLESGSIVAEAVADPDVFAGVDGCEPIVPTALGYQVLTADGVERDTVLGDIVAVAPDGRTIVVDARNRLALLDRVDVTDDEQDGEAIDIGPTGRSVLFADLP